MAEDSNELELEGLREVPASEILAKIEKGNPVEYNNVIIKDDLSNLDYTIESRIKILNSQFNGYLEFSGSIFKKSVDFTGTRFNAGASFEYARFNGEADFAKTYFDRGMFIAAHFKKTADFSGTHFRQGNWTYARFDEKAIFFGAQFDEYISFRCAKFDSRANFSRAKISGLDSPDIFKGVKFKKSDDEERVCRKAKKLLEEQGNKEEADNYFYHEIAARRKQKPWYIRYPEFVFIQLIFGYGVHPFRLMAWWFFFVGIFAWIYWKWNGVTGALQPLDYIWFSITVAVTPGFAGYKPTSGLFQVVAGLEAIFGTFMWAAFIATFARKYMR
jgi:hypothetical protein